MARTYKSFAQPYICKAHCEYYLLLEVSYKIIVYLLTVKLDFSLVNRRFRKFRWGFTHSFLEGTKKVYRKLKLYKRVYKLKHQEESEKT